MGIVGPVSFVECDNCGKRSENVYRSMFRCDIEHMFKNDGWTFDGDRALCPECSEAVMTAEQAWEELKEKFHHREGTEYLLYFWRPDESTPVTKSMMEDLADAYAVVSVPEALGTIIVYAKWPERGWEPNPWDTRHLIRHLVDRLRETTHE